MLRATSDCYKEFQYKAVSHVYGCSRFIVVRYIYNYNMQISLLHNALHQT
jgi:hypothetical protein